MSDPDYCYPPDFTVLRNKLDIRDAPTLEAAERRFVAQRLLEAVPTGDFDLDHLRAIHRHLFRDICEWAGEIRTVEIAKGDSRFQPRRFIEAGMADVHRRIAAAAYFRDTSPEEFADGAGPILGDVNHVHPFREGNGRAQLQYLRRSVWSPASSRPRRLNGRSSARKRAAVSTRPRGRDTAGTGPRTRRSPANRKPSR